MTKFIRLLHFLCCLFFGFLAYGEEVEKITTPHFSIRCDKKAVSSAQRIANTLETIYHPVSKTLGVHPSFMPLRLNNQSAELNAYFKAVPCHISFDTLYYSNPYFIGNADWFNMLCIHEFRHAAQHSIEYHSTPWWLKFPYFVWNMVAVCGVDSFFKEGDAVGIETALSKSGRGRLPGWERIYKVNLLECEPTSFSRQVFGSLKHEMPSEYHIGYYFTTHIRRKYGVHAIQSIFKETIRGLPYLGFRNAFKKVTKKSMLKVYEEMNEELRLSWQKQLEGLKITPATQLTVKRPDDSFDYNGTFIDPSGRLIAWKAGIGLRPQLVQVNLATSKKTFSSLRKRLSTKRAYAEEFVEDTERRNRSVLDVREDLSTGPASKLPAEVAFCRKSKDKTILYFMPSTLPPAAFAIGEGCAVWLETVQHPWQHNRKTIRLQYYDFKQRKRRTLVSTTRYTALAMSPSTHQLVAVTSDEMGKHFLVVLETKSGKVIKKIDNPDNGYYLTPSWAGENDLVVVKTKDQKNSVLRIHVATGKVEVLLPYTYEHRSYPKIYKDYLLYNSSYNGIDNIYAMELSTKACFQVTSRKYGAYLGMVDPISNQLIFNDYTKNGMDIAVMPFDPLLWTPLEEVEDRSVNYYDPLVAQEQNSDILEKVPNALYPLTKYHFLADSLSFIGTDAVPDWYDRGFKVKLFQLVDFEDKLNITPYFYQNFNVFGITRGDVYKTNELGLAIKYVTPYPVLELDVKGMRYKNKVMAKVIEACKQVKLRAIPIPDRYGREVWKIPMYYISDTYWTPALKLGIKFPYYFDLGSSSGQAYVEAKVNLERCNGKIAHTETYAFKISNASTQSARDIYPPWYQSLEVKFKDAKKNPQLLRGAENILSFAAELCMPGIGNHHYFSLNPLVERLKKLDQHEPFWQRGIYLAYGLPLAYPECGIPLTWFLQRIWLEGYCNVGDFSTLDRIGRDFNTIGAIFSFKSRFLSNKNIPYAILKIDFPFCKKKEDEKWDFQFPVPKFDISFYYEARKEVEFTKKTRCIPHTPCNY